MRFLDDRAQWLLLSGLIVSIGLIALVLVLNNAVLSGHSSTKAITSFPKNELRDLRSNSISEVLILGETINNNLSTGNKIELFNVNFSRFRNETYNMSLIHGGLIDISATPAIYTFGPGNSNSIISNVTLSIRYEDESTAYKENLVLDIRG